MASVQRRSIHCLAFAAILAFALSAPASAVAQVAPAFAVTPEPDRTTLSSAVTTSATPAPDTMAATPVRAPFTQAGVAGVRTTAAADALPSATRRAESVSPAALMQRAGSGLDRSEVMMIVGGAAIILGLVTDGAASDLLIIGGAGVGLFGLYHYLQ